MERRSTKNLVMAGLCIALSQVLSYVKVFEMPQGGSITAGSMVPIILFSLVYGFKDGFLAAIVPTPVPAGSLPGCAYPLPFYKISDRSLVPVSSLPMHIVGFGPQ